ncbi:MAG TPA: FAD-binding oxidoreductase [Nocardioidaceae bacterium]|nr:FAD-binding oxidoreductase [Nocardioidaceae bacterium]
MFWTKPGDEDYDERRALFNAMIDKRPRLIAACETPADVRAALERARADDLEVAVRAGGHSVAGMSTNDDGLVIDVRPMQSIEVDTINRRVRVGAGVLWGELDVATQTHGLATTGGRVSTTGVTGFTIGGGSGWLDRRYGMACDNLLAAELVLADGTEVRADAEHHPDLFWALRGGGGNFGVVTSLELALHQVGPTVEAGIFAWPTASRGHEIARAYRDWAEGAPEELGSWLLMTTGPDEDFVPDKLKGAPISLVAAMWAGDPADGHEVMAPLRALDPPIDLMEPRAYTEFQSMLDDVPGNRHYWSAEYHDSFPDDALDILVRSALEAPSELAQQIVFRWGGAVGRVAEEDTPMTQRDAQWVTHPFAVWQEPLEDRANIEWVKQFRRDIAPYATGGVYLNFIGDEGEARIRQAYGEAKYDRLRQVKAAYDPDNVFRGNQNIAPAAQSVGLADTGHVEVRHT